MIKRIKPRDITKDLSDETLYALAEMAEETPVSQDWIDCSRKLTDEQKFKVYEIRSIVRENKEKNRRESLTKEERLAEDKKREEWFKKASEDPDGFYGNMGNPEYP